MEHPTPTNLPGLLHQRAQASPDRDFLRMRGRQLTYGEADRQIDAYACGLYDLGIRHGEHAVLFMDNGIEQVLLWFALNRLGAVSVPLNTTLTGEFLVRSIELVQPALIVADTALAPILLKALPAEPGSAPLFIHGPFLGASASIERARRLETLSRAFGPLPIVQTSPLEPAVMLFTSGTTGVPKACVLSHHYLLRQGQLHARYLQFGANDVLYTAFPLFHIDAATLTVGAAAAAGCTAALGERFSASGFWEDIRDVDATVFNFMGATANILWKQGFSSEDRDHRVRLAWGVPMPACEPQWQDRYGFPLVEVYGLTDAGLPAYQPLNLPRRPGSCGRVIPEYQVSIQDPDGVLLTAGRVGEICIRSDEPGLVMTEYFAMPELTAEAFRGGWFHTGDLGRLDEDGYLFFVSRNKDVIRRRGENIAASDIEAAVDAHPAVRESAALGVPSELSEDDVKVCVAVQPGESLTPDEVVRHCREVLPGHMVPRYVEIVSSLPKTPTQKIQRRKLIESAFTPTTWDAQANDWVRPTNNSKETA